MQTQVGFSEEDPHYGLDGGEECRKAKLESVIAADPVGKVVEVGKRESTTAKAQTMEDVAKKYQEIRLDDDSESEGGNQFGNNEEDDDDLLNSGSEVLSEAENDRMRQQSGVSAARSSGLSSYRQTSSAAEENEIEEERASEDSTNNGARGEEEGYQRSTSQASTVAKRGQPNDRLSFSSSASGWATDGEYLRRLEADQEELSGSLLALTSHFAQVQFRLKQVKAAPPAEKERLLAELETLAFRGVPDLRVVQEEDEECDTAAATGDESEANGSSGRQRLRTALRGKKQAELIEQLKTQLTDLEQLAYESGELPALPTAKRLHNQQVLMERLQQRLALRNDGLGIPSGTDAAGVISDLLGDLERVPAEQGEFDNLVERAVGAILNPVRVKEKVVEQLKTQIVDLERFIEFLQCGGTGPPPAGFEAVASAARRPNANSSSSVRANQRAHPADRNMSKSTAASDPVSRTSARRGNPQEGQSSRSNWGSQESGRQNERVGVNSQHSSRNSRGAHDQQSEATEANSIMKRMAALVHIFVLTNLACMNRGRVQHAATSNAGAVHVNTVKEHHYGQALARLQVLVDRVCQLATENSQDAAPAQSRAKSRDARQLNTSAKNSKAPPRSVTEPNTLETHPQPDDSVTYASDDDECYLAAHEYTLTSLVRKQLIPVVRELLEHGMLDVRTSKPAITACLSSSARAAAANAPRKAGSAWRLFARYYELKGGRQWNAQPARNLSAAFSIDVVGGQSVSAKQTLLAAIDRVLALHSKFKRSDDAKFKALLCLALNERRLVAWLRLIVHNQAIVDEFYETWSYVAMTGFEDAFRALARLQSLTFRLPFDLAVRQLQNIKDAF